MRKGANLLIVQNEISSPKGNAIIKVKTNKIQDSEKPFKSIAETSKKFSIFLFLVIKHLMHQYLNQLYKFEPKMP